MKAAAVYKWTRGRPRSVPITGDGDAAASRSGLTVHMGLIHHLRFPALLLVLVTGACDVLDSSPVVCTRELRFGLIVTVEDSVTGAPAAADARLVARDGAYADTVIGPSPATDPNALTLFAVPERPGTYELTVSKNGFLTWQRSRVIVTADECHVRPVAVTARLRHAP